MISQKHIFGPYPKKSHDEYNNSLHKWQNVLQKRLRTLFNTTAQEQHLDWCAETYNYQVVILVLVFIHIYCGIYCLKFDQGLKFTANLWVCHKVELLIRVLLSVDKVLGCVLVCALQLATQLPYPENGSLHCNSICQSGHSQGGLALSLTPAREFCLIAMPFPGT